MLPLCALAGATVAMLASPAAAETRLQKTFADWMVTCVDNGSQKNCTLLTRAVTKTNVTAFVWTIRVVDKQLKSQFLVPPNITVADGIRFSITDASPVTATFNSCGPRWCRAEFPLDAALLKKISAAQKATADFVAGGKKPVQVELNLAQFGDAYQYLYQQQVTK